MVFYPDWRRHDGFGGTRAALLDATGVNRAGRYNGANFTTSLAAIMSNSTPVRSRKSIWFLALGATVALAVAAAGYMSMSNVQAAPSVTYTSITGEKITSESLRGRVVMVNFWATSCVTCVKEMPQMVETYNKYKAQGMEFVAVAMSYDPPNYVLNFTETRQLPFKVALDVQGDIARAFGNVQLTPTTFVIDKQGNVIKRYVGEPDFGALHKLLEKALAS